MNLYNEIDPYAAQWLRGLIHAGAAKVFELVVTVVG